MSRLIESGLSQGTKANMSGKATRDTVTSYLSQLGGLLYEPAATLDAFKDVEVGGMYSAPGVYSKDVKLQDDVYGTETGFCAHFLIRMRHWDAAISPLAVFFQSQSTGGSAANSLCRLLLNLEGRLCRAEDACPVPFALLLVGSEWKLPDCLGKLEYAQRRARGKILRVFLGVDDFREWVVGGLPYPDGQMSFA